MSSLNAVRSPFPPTRDGQDRMTTTTGLGCCRAGSRCNVQRCGACFVDRHHEDLKNEFPWMEFNADPFGVGCSICKKHYGSSADSKRKAGFDWRRGTVTLYTSLQRRRLLKHEKSDDHTRAAQRKMPDQDSNLAPTLKQCKKLLDHARKAPLGVEGVDAIGGQKKCRKLLWCIAEAHRDLKRDWFTEGKGVDGRPLIQSTTIFQDARKGRLTLRFTTANSMLNRGEGLFGVADLANDFSLDSVGLMKATMSIISTFCTRRKHPPHVERPSQASLDSDLLLRVVASIETFVSDAAADEIRAGHMLARQSTAEDYLPRLPGLKIVIRDKPHAVRRFLTRGWKSDDFLDDVAARFIFQQGSPTKMIQFSDVFKAWFSSSIKMIDPEISAVQLSKHIHDLGFAAHRFESASKPMARITVFFHAFLTTVCRIAWERKGLSEGKQADAFCRWLDEEKCIQFAMLADCALENINLIRALDYQQFPVDELTGRIAAYKDRIRALFAGPNPLCKTSGCCGHMLQVLQRQLALSLPGPGGANRANQLVLGGPRPVSDEIINRCLQRMCNWICIVESTIDAEFPHFEVIQAFGAFNVKGDIELDQGRLASCSRQLSKLQQAFKFVDDGSLAPQFQSLWFVARQVMLDEGGSSVSAWMAAIRKVTRTNKRMDVSDLLPLLVRYWAAGGSTSGVEQSFSQGQKLFDHLQLLQHVNDIMEARKDLLLVFDIMACALLVPLHVHVNIYVCHQIGSW